MKKYLKLDWSVKMPLYWLINGVAGSSVVMGPEKAYCIHSSPEFTWVPFFSSRHEKLENRHFSLKTPQMFSVHTTGI